MGKRSAQQTDQINIKFIKRGIKRGERKGPAVETVEVEVTERPNR
jgi:hypothetical protein